MSKKQETPHFIIDFVKELTGSPDLYLSFFNERQALTDATELMRKQKSELATLRRELAVAKRALEILADQVPDDCPLDYAPDCDRNKIVETIGCRDADCTHRPESCWITAATVRATAELEAENAPVNG